MNRNVDTTVDAAKAQQLWDTLIRTRRQSPAITAAEDAVFRFYLPLARTLARGQSPRAVDPDLVEQAAELGLAKAVLAWRRPDSAAFTAFARTAIHLQMRQTPATS